MVAFSGFGADLVAAAGAAGFAHDACVVATRREHGEKLAFVDGVIDHYVRAAEWEQEEYDRRITDWEVKRGFERA